MTTPEAKRGSRDIRPGEAMAIDRSAMRRGPEAFFLLWSNPCAQNERVGASGQIAVVNIRGPLDHHDEGWGDSYAAILKRVTAALKGDDVKQANKARALDRARRVRWDELSEEDATAEEAADPTPGKPSAIVFRLDSPGGVVAGLNETVKALRKAITASGIPAYAFVDEISTSASYAVSCACDEVYLPPSAITGSIGVISTMVDQTAYDKKQGFRFATITSGARKADGHPHVAISDDAMAAEQARVDKLAGQFFRLVSEARGLPIPEIKALDAGIFLGAEAVKRGLADGVMGWDDFVAAVEERDADGESQGAKGLVGAPRSESPKSGVSPKGKTNMSKLGIRNLIAQKKKALASAKDAKKKTALRADIAALEKSFAMLGGDTTPKPAAKKTSVIEHKERHTDDTPGEDDDEDGGAGDGEDEESEEEAEGNETDRGDDPEGDEDDDGEDEEEEESEEESEEEASAAEVVRSALTHVKDPRERQKLRGQLAALTGKAALYDKHGARLQRLEAEALASKKTALITAAVNAHKITRSEATRLGKEPIRHVKFFLSMRPKAVVHTSQEDLAVAGETVVSGTEAAKHGLSEGEFKAIKAAHAAAPHITLEAFVKNYVEQQKAQRAQGGN